MAKILIDSSLNCIRTDLPDDAEGINVVSTPIPEGIEYPQWVNNAWQEYNIDDDPLCQASDMGDGLPLVYAESI